MLYVLMFVTALILANVFKWNLLAAALVSVVGWSFIGAIFRAVARGGKSTNASEEATKQVNGTKTNTGQSGDA